ncbi:MAG: glycosyltransferase [Bdellovibrionota bacterium]
MSLLRPRVLILIDTARIGGPGKGILQLLEWSHSEESFLRVATFQSRRHRSSEFIEELQKNGHTPLILQERGRYDLSPLRTLSRELLQGKYDIVQSHGYKAHLYAQLITRMIAIKWIAVLNGWTAENWRVRVYHALDRLNIRRASTIVAVSEELRTYARKVASGVPSRVISNAVDVHERVPVRRYHQGGVFRLGVFGRLSPEKGHRFLFEALGGIPEASHIFEVDIIGEGVERERLEELARQLGLHRSIRFRGYQRNLRAHYESSDLIVLPSLREGSPNVLLEAMSLGMPVLASDIPSIRAVINEGHTGFLFATADSNALRAKLLEIMSLSECQLSDIGEAARSYVRKEFNPEVRQQRFAQLYQELAFPT